MTSYTTTFKRHQPPPHSRRIYQRAHPTSDTWDSLSQPSIVVSIVVLGLAVAYQTAHTRAAARGRQLPTVVELLWNTIVYLIPACVLYAVDRWANPPLFPLRMLQPSPTTHAAKSEVLRRILRTDQPGGIVASMSQAGRRAYSSTFSNQRDSSQPAGLGNWDNSCFQNSVIQGLSSLTHLPRYLNALTPGLNTKDDDSSTTVGALRAFTAELSDPSSNGKTLYTPGILKTMSTISQQDAQEYYSSLMERVDKEVEKGVKAGYKPFGLEADLSRDESVASQHSDDSGYQSLPMQSKAGSELVTFRNPLEGLSAQRVACTACGHSEGMSMIPFNCMTLAFDAGVGQYTLEQLLDKFVGLEMMKGVDCVKCSLLAYRQGLEKMAKAVPMAAERLRVVETILEEDGYDEESLKKLKLPESRKVSSTKTMQVAIARSPRSLAIHMNRSVFDPVTFDSYKNLAAVEFPSVLDIGPWCIGSAQRAQLPASHVPPDGDASRQEEETREQWILDPTASMVAGSGSAHDSRISGPIYELRAVITHYGRHDNGHYVCYRKHPRRTAETVDEPEAGDIATQLPSSPISSALDNENTFSINSQTGYALPTPPATPPLREEDDEPSAPEPESQWWRLSDETVWPVTEEEVLAQGGVFMLFYDCVDPNAVLVTPASDLSEITPDPVEPGRTSPSRSEESEATLFEPSEVSLVADSSLDKRVHGELDGELDGVSQVSLVETVEDNDQPISDELKSTIESTEQHTAGADHAVSPTGQLSRQDGACEVSVVEVTDDEDKSTTEDFMEQNVQEYEPTKQAEHTLSLASSVTMGRDVSEPNASTMGQDEVDMVLSEIRSVTMERGDSVASTVTLATEEDSVQSEDPNDDDKMDFAQPTTR